ncbi:galactose oxidase [Imleria badia]|nr:galactose oxidase [Imleria badia]
MSLRWSLVSALASNARSSHCAAVTNTARLLLYSGELVPRIPVDSTVHVLDLDSAVPPRTLEASPAYSHAPVPRVGASAVHDPHTNALYVWGGRGGVNMAPLDRFQAGIWKAQLDELDSAAAITWERLPTVNDDSDAAPALRSYHASVLAGGKLYVHAGCPASGRLAELHAYDLATHTWHRLADAPAQPRGGTAIAAISLSPKSELVLVRFGGFAGIQLPQDTPPPLDIYTPSTNTWSTVYPAPDPEHGYPGARSVHGLVPFVAGTHANTFEAGPVPVALLYYGERDASSLGHAGAGVFWDDAWLLLASSSALQWKKLRVDGNPTPEPRGWFAPASYVRDGKTRVVLAGGLLSSNERSGQVWVGDVEL